MIIEYIKTILFILFFSLYLVFNSIWKILLKVLIFVLMNSPLILFLSSIISAIGISYFAHIEKISWNWLYAPLGGVVFAFILLVFVVINKFNRLGH